MSAILTLMGRATIKTKGLMTGWMNDCREEREREIMLPLTQRTYYLEHPSHHEKHQFISVYVLLSK